MSPAAKPARSTAWLRHPGLPPRRPTGLLLSNFTTTSAPTSSGSQLVFAGVCSLALYGICVFVQTVRHRDYFLPVGVDDSEVHVLQLSCVFSL